MPDPLPQPDLVPALDALPTSRAQTRRASLAQQHLRWLLSLFGALAALILVSVLGFVLLPLSERSADDLAALMVLSAQTWVELPPQTRPAFEAELLRQHQLALRADLALPGSDALNHGFYIGFVEQALQRRAGSPALLTPRPGPQGEPWLWTPVSVGGQTLAVGFAVERLSTRPMWALGVVLLAGTALAGAAAVWMARRIARPVARLEQAAAELAAGASPALLPQSGPLELARLAGHFNHMALQVRELLQARTTLLAGISHDLRTPLARMRLALEMLRLQPTPALITRLEQDVEEMNGLIGQMLSLARGLDAEPAQDLMLAPWLAGRVQLLTSAAQAAGAGLEVHCAPDLQARAAPAVLARVLDNLVGNALRYAPGPVQIKVQRAAGTDAVAPGPVLRISVLDRGPGIPPAQMQAVWQPFARMEASRNAQTGGYGLGLAIVRQLAQAQGWTTGMAPRPGGGLAVWVDLPEHRPSAAVA